MSTLEITKINNIRGSVKDINVIGKVISKNDEPTPRKRHAIATISDGAGKIRLSLWNNQVDQVDVGDFVFVSNAFMKKDKKRISLQTWAPIIQKIKENEAYSLGFSNAL